jgi:hypothetical protein
MPLVVGLVVDVGHAGSGGQCRYDGGHEGCAVGGVDRQRGDGRRGKDRTHASRADPAYGYARRLLGFLAIL